jgi:hypothetical protein
LSEQWDIDARNCVIHTFADADFSLFLAPSGGVLAECFRRVCSTRPCAITPTSFYIASKNPCELTGTLSRLDFAATWAHRKFLRIRRPCGAPGCLF